MQDDFQKALTTCLVKNNIDSTNQELDGIKKLLVADEKVDPSHSATWGLFTLAVCNKRSDVAILLVKNGLDVQARMKPKNQTPLHLAAEAGDQKTAEFLVQNGANTKAKDQKRRTPAKLAHHNGHMELARFLDPDLSNTKIPDSPTQAPKNRASKLISLLPRPNKGTAPK